MALKRKLFISIFIRLALSLATFLAYLCHPPFQLAGGFDLTNLAVCIKQSSNVFC